MEDQNILTKIKDFLINNIIIIFAILIIIVLILIFLPNKNGPTGPKDSVLTLTLKGNKNVSIMKGETYQEAGYIAYDTVDGDLTASVVVIGIVNTNAIGSYNIKYSVMNSKGKVVEETRTVNVVADLSDIKIDIDYSPKELTNKDVTITIKVTGDGYSFLVDHDGNIINSNVITYPVSVNDEYIFSIKRKDGAIIEKIVEINNIDKKKPVGSCKSVITDNKTVITVDATDESGIEKYSYTVGTYTNESNSNTYTVNASIKTAAVTIYDKASNYEIINCIVEDKTTPIVTPTPSEPTPSTHYHALTFEGINYLIYYPDNLDLTRKNPLVIFLHGDGEVGTSVSRLSNLIFVKNMKSGKFKNAVYLVPQRPGGSYWDNYLPTVERLINSVKTSYNIDPNRISVTGHSSGGIGVYTIIGRNPNMFSAAAVLSGRNKDVSVSKLTSTPIRHYHGTNDRSVLYSKGEASARDIKNAGGNIEFIPLEGKAHNITDYVYNSTNVIEWMLAQTR